MEAVWRLVWAFPLVLGVGGMTILAMKRLLAPASSVARTARRMSLCESLTLSEGARAHLVEVDGRTLVIVESAGHAVIQASPVSASEASRIVRFGRPWWQRLTGAEVR